MPAYETELESMNELEAELESEFESELESELELESEGEFESESESELEFEGEGEFEFETEAEFENPARRVYADAMMEHLGHVAAEAETEQEAAEQLLPLVGLAAKKLVPMVAKAVAPSLKRALPHMAKAITRVEPRLTHGITRIAKVLYRNPQTRALLKTVPAIARRTVYSVARRAAQGTPISAKGALRTLATQARHVLLHPHHRRHALRRSTVLDNHLHRRIAPGSARPHARHYRRWGYPYGYRRGHAGAAHAAGASVTPSGPGTVVRGGVPRYAVTPGMAGCNCGAAAAPTQYCRCCGQLIR